MLNKLMLANNGKLPFFSVQAKKIWFTKTINKVLYYHKTL